MRYLLPPRLYKLAFLLVLCLQALVDAPAMVRRQMNLKSLTLTDITIDIKRVPKKRTLVEAMEAAGEC